MLSFFYAYLFVSFFLYFILLSLASFLWYWLLFSSPSCHQVVILCCNIVLLISQIQWWLDSSSGFIYIYLFSVLLAVPMLFSAVCVSEMKWAELDLTYDKMGRTLYTGWLACSHLTQLWPVTDWSIWGLSMGLHLGWDLCTKTVC